jgi:hypothetical protein
VTAAFVEREKNGGYAREPYIVLRIDAEGAEYLRGALIDEYARTEDGGAYDIAQELAKALEQHRHLTTKEEDQ